MKIQLLKLTLLNFKGQRNLTVDFEDITNIYGDNAVGKTTIFDAFMWLLFGKDSTDRKDFEVKTLDKQNKVIEKIDHEVTGVFLINNREVTIKRGLRENWEKRRGGVEMFNNGNEQYFFWDDVPLQAKQFQDKVNGLVDERVFKLITNPFYFNTLKWQDRRATLLQIAGKIDDTAILESIANTSNRQHVDAIIEAFNAKKTVDEYKSQLAAKKKLLKKNLDEIPGRIDEAKRMTPGPKDYTSIELQIASLSAQVKGVEDKMMDASRVQESNLQAIQAKQSRLHEARMKVREIENTVKERLSKNRMGRQEEIRRQENTMADQKGQYEQLEYKIKVGKDRIAQNFTTIDNLRNQYEEEYAKELVFKDSEFCCPACKRPFEDGVINTKKEELTGNFNKAKSATLDSIVARANELKAQNENLQAEVVKMNNQVIDLKQAYNLKLSDYNMMKDEDSRLSSQADQTFKQAIAADIEYRQQHDLISSLEYELNKPVDSTVRSNTDALREEKNNLQQQVSNLQRELNTKEQREKGLARVNDLENEQSNLSQQLADLEGYEFAIEQFTRAKMDALVDRVNDRFRLVKFKMFDTQVNGGEVECCETLINGVPFSDANNAARINAGLDIINVLSDHYCTSAPVIVDNAESVNTLIPVNGQLIRLVVSNDTTLRIEHPKYVAVSLFDRVAV